MFYANHASISAELSQSGSAIFPLKQSDHVQMKEKKKKRKESKGGIAQVAPISEGTGSRGKPKCVKLKSSHVG